MFNKFKVFKIAVVGMTGLLMASSAATQLGVKVDPRAEIAVNTFVPLVQDKTIQYGNYLWNKEIAYENKDVLGVNFYDKAESESDFDYDKDYLEVDYKSYDSITKTDKEE